mgnify:CR=1 FL=1
MKGGMGDLGKNVMKLDDFDFDELLECSAEDIEYSAFFASSFQLMKLVDGMTGAIDDRLTKKKLGLVPLQSTKNNAGSSMLSQRMFTKVH